MALEATGHSVRLVAGVSLYRVARASAWAFGCGPDERRLHGALEHYETYAVHGGTQPDRADGKTNRLLCGGVGRALRCAHR